MAITPTIQGVRPASGGPTAIEIGVERLPQLFHTLDPFPFRERDLDRGAEEYIVDWARELPRDQKLRIIVHLPPAEAETAAAQELETALRHYFAYRGDAVGRDLKELFRIGWRALVIGAAVLGLCLTLDNVVTHLIASPSVERFISEGLFILGWVANWRPMEIFLYDWWPIMRRRDLYRRLAAASVELRPTAPPGVDMSAESPG